MRTLVIIPAFNFVEIGKNGVITGISHRIIEKINSPIPSL